ncbi:Hypothetical protein NTJ_07502 [Nesidiocoris tenuis]|uniref:Uncharacterized protein n=1 Tax=Nesidiocoris tenuis TaxID=355587 RepID=A0ABN7AR48_9HEMI|nr:Hypothetical protein NTJ_07502 [Nesidiocoris tenuis]
MKLGAKSASGRKRIARGSLTQSRARDSPPRDSPSRSFARVPVRRKITRTRSPVFKFGLDLCEKRNPAMLNLGNIMANVREKTNIYRRMSSRR